MARFVAKNMNNSYLWVKTFHIVLITSWFAGLFYLPRIFVNLADEKNPDAYTRLLGMADRLYRFMTILAVPAVLLGMTLWCWRWRCLDACKVIFCSLTYRLPPHLL